jgi:uncharacterized membrane protein HdeD (DUF308 family)
MYRRVNLVNSIKSLVWPIGTVALALLVVGLIAVTAPNMNVPTLMLYLGVILLIIGGVQLLIALLLRNKIKLWPALLVLSLLFLYLGFQSFTNADTAAIYFEYGIAIWAALTGLAQIALSFQNKNARMVLLSFGLLSIIIAAVMYFSDNTQNMQFLFGFYTLLLSISLLYGIYILLRLKTDERATTVDTNKNT